MKLSFYSVLLCICFSFPIVLESQAIVNEIQSNNQVTLKIDGERPDWIELYNPSNTSISLEDYYLSDNPQIIDKFQLPKIIIEPNQYLIILADGLDTADEFIHTNFKISSQGETIIFSDPSTNIISEIQVPSLNQDESYALVNTIWITTIPTPGSVNEEDTTPRASPPTFSHNSGLYQNEVALKISSSDSEARLKIFTNTVDDFQTYQNQYDDLIDNTSSICAQVIRAGYKDSEMLCHTFILDQQHEIPIISIVGSEEELFDEIDGLFVKGPNADEDWPFWGANFWNDKDSEVYFQYFNNKQNEIYIGHADLEMHGGRESRTKPQKSFRLMAKNKYDLPYFIFPFFTDKPEIDTFKRLVLRNGSGDYSAAHLRDGFLQSYLIQNDLNLDANANEAVAVYINGSYYGLMGLREKMDKYYALSNYNEKDVDLLEDNGVVLEGDSSQFKSDYKYVTENDLSINAFYEAARQKVDLLNLTDYFHSQIGNVSTAWPQNNIKYWRPKVDNAKWRFLLFDMDISLGRHPWTLADENALLNKMTSFDNQNKFINTVNAFLAHGNFYNYFMNRHQDLFNTTFKTENMTAALLSYVDHIDSEMQLHYKRWPNIEYSHWKEFEIPKIVDFLEDRPSFAMEHMNEFFDLGGLINLRILESQSGKGRYQLNSIEDIEVNFEGRYFKKVPVTIEVFPEENYYFKHWKIVSGNELRTVSKPKFSALFDSNTSIEAIYYDEEPKEWVEFVSFQNGQIQIKIHNKSRSDIQCSLYDLAGKRISSYIFNNPLLGTHLKTVPADFPSGMIIVQIKQGNNGSSHKVIIP